MNTNNPESPRQNEDYPLPEFLGCPPDEGPERLPEPPWDDLSEIIGEIKTRFPWLDPGPSDHHFYRFLQAFEVLHYDDWKAAIAIFLKRPDLWTPPPSRIWGSLTSSLAARVSAIHENPNSPAASRQKELKSFFASIPTIEKARYRQIHGIVKTSATPKKFKDIPPSRALLLLTSHIQDQDPSGKRKLIIVKALARCWNKHSSKGKKVYPYGLAHLCRLVHLPLRKTKDGRTTPGSTFDRNWAWLRKHGFVNKAWNENQEAHRCAGWYVCTSLQQVGYFRDPRNRARKIGR